MNPSLQQRIAPFGLVALAALAAALCSWGLSRLPSVPGGLTAPGFGEYDLLITNARIADGTGGPLIYGSVAVKDRRVVAIGNVRGSAAKEVDAEGRVVAPGFIDVHTHSEDIGRNPVAENFLRMGVTTIVTGNCGGSRVDVAAFFKELEQVGVTLNVATLIGHNSVRQEVMGGSFLRAPSPEQMERMKSLVDRAMEDGAVGLSTGLIYTPGTFAKTEEIVELAKVASAHGGIYASHMRAETVKIFDAIEELLTVAREAKIRAELSHIKLSGPTAWGKTAEVLSLLDKARASGIEVTHDQYAYTASSTGLVQLIPDKALDGGRAAFLARLADPAKKAAILEDMKASRERQGRADYSYAVIARFRADPALNGLSISQAAKLKRGSDSLDDQIELLFDIERRGGGSGVFHGMDEEDVQAFMKHPCTMIASDGGPRKLGEDIPHPRSYGNNARVLGRYVRELKVLTLPEAIRRMTSLPAQTFRLADRGVLKPGAWADMVIFDPEKVGDVATFDDPHHYSVGFSDVIVNGTPVIRAGTLTAARPGGPLRMSPVATPAQ
jgi:N-acyl-D-amino-acid deacylase